MESFHLEFTFINSIIEVSIKWNHDDEQPGTNYQAHLFGI